MTKVTVVGSGKYGSMTALRVAEYDIADTVIITKILLIVM
jgi:malate dehydrogenase